MKIFEVKPLFDADGNNSYRHIFARNTSDLWRKTGDGEVVEVEWGEGDEALPLGDFIPITASVMCGQANLVRRIRDEFAPGAALQPLKVDGHVGKLLMLRPEHSAPGSPGCNHLFREIDGREGLLATSVFVDFWTGQGLTGAKFVSCGELPDECFVRPS